MQKLFIIKSDKTLLPSATPQASRLESGKNINLQPKTYNLTEVKFVARIGKVQTVFNIVDKTSQLFLFTDS